MIFRPPGTGKTLLMDLFFDSLPIRQKFRRHYHHFLLSLYSLVSQRLQQSKLSVDEVSEVLSSKHQPTGYLPPKQDRARNKALSLGWRSVFAGGGDPRDPALNGPNFVLAQVARDLILHHGWVLAFDEIQMVDVAGAGILSRVLEWYWRLGGVVLGTSNRVPEHMYDQGVQKSTVAPFLDRLKFKSPSISINSDHDWRLKASAPLSTEDLTNVSHWYQNMDPLLWKQLVASHVISSVQTELIVYGRPVVITRSDPTTRTAVFLYQELCEAALGPADYLTICSKFETIMIEGIPIFTTLMKNEARRLITFIDAAYECGVKLYVNSSSSIDGLFFPDASSPSDKEDFIELETLADMVEELSQPFRPNVSNYEYVGNRSTRASNHLPQPNTSPASVENLAIFTGKDEQYAFDRATSRLFELTRPGGRVSKKWTPIELDMLSSPSFSSPTTPRQDTTKLDLSQDLDRTENSNADDPRNNCDQSASGQNELGTRHLTAEDSSLSLKPPEISEVHFWGIARWGKRAGRWGQGVEIFKKKSR